MGKAEIIEPVEARRNPGAVPRERLQQFEGLVGYFRAFVAMCQDREYKFPLRLKVLMTLTAIYVLSPLDLLPEALFAFFGLADDLALMAFTFTMVREEVGRYISGKEKPLE